MDRRPFLKRDTLLAAASIYKGKSDYIAYKNFVYSCFIACIELHGNPDGSIPATFSVIYLVSVLLNKCIFSSTDKPPPLYRLVGNLLKIHHCQRNVVQRMLN